MGAFMPAFEGSVKSVLETPTYLTVNLKVTTWLRTSGLSKVVGASINTIPRELRPAFRNSFLISSMIMGDGLSHY